MDLSIIIINWNSSHYLRKCIESIYAGTKEIKFEIVVLDNASYDGCGEMLAREYPAVIFIQGEKNLGFACGNNLAVSHSTGDVLLFLNPDTEIHEPAIRLLFDAINSLPDAGTVGCALLNSDGSVQTSCVQAIPTISNHLLDADLLRDACPNARIWGMTALLSGTDKPQPVEAISGACLMTPRKTFQQVGGFSEDYFMYYEDADYCLNVLKSGQKNYYIPNAVVTHYGGKSSGAGRFSAVMMSESAWRFFLKQHGMLYASLFRCGLAAKAIFRFSLIAVRTLAHLIKHQERESTGLRKWAYVLSWCLGAEPWVIDYPETRF